MAVFVGVFLYGTPAPAGEPAIPVEKPVENGGKGLEDGYTGRQVPAFAASTTTGRTVSTGHPPKALIIDLWGLNCASCLEEMVALEAIYQEYRERGLEIWSVNAEDIGPDRIVAGLEKKGISVSYDLVVDPGLAVTHLFTRWFIPVTVVVDRAGTVQYYKVGFGKKDADRLKAKVEELLD